MKLRIKSFFHDTLSGLEKEHVMAIGYLYTIAIPLVTSVFSFKIMMSNVSSIVGFIIAVLATVITSWFSYEAIRRSIAAFTKKRFMIGFTGAFVFIYSILFSMVWIYLILGLLINVNVIIFGEGTRIFSMKLLIQLFRWLPENSSLITTVASLISLSLMLTPLLPDKFNKVNVDTKGTAPSQVDSSNN